MFPQSVVCAATDNSASINDESNLLLLTRTLSVLRHEAQCDDLHTGWHDKINPVMRFEMWYVSSARSAEGSALGREAYKQIREMISTSYQSAASVGLMQKNNLNMFQRLKKKKYKPAYCKLNYNRSWCSGNKYTQGVLVLRHSTVPIMIFGVSWNTCASVQNGVCNIQRDGSFRAHIRHHCAFFCRAHPN